MKHPKRAPNSRRLEATTIGLADSGHGRVAPVGGQPDQYAGIAGPASTTARSEPEPPGEGAILTDPLVPSTYDVVWAMVMLVPLVLAVGALVSLGRSRSA